jgi:hypothetical protein
MTIHWDSLLAVFLVSLGSTVAVVVLVALAVVGLSARAAAPRETDGAPRLSPALGTALAGACLAAVALIMLFGLWAIVSR